MFDIWQNLLDFYSIYFSLSVNISVSDVQAVSSYELVVECYTASVPEMVATTTVVMDIEDKNDNPPEFTSEVYTVQIAEDVPIGSNILQVSDTVMSL